MQINISNTSSEVESLRQIIATLTDQTQDLSEQNNNWSLKYQQLEQEKSKLSSSNSELLVNHISLNTRYSALESNRVERPFAESPSHTTVRAMSHTAVSDLCLTKASKIEKSVNCLNHFRLNA